MDIPTAPLQTTKLITLTLCALLCACGSDTEGAAPTEGSPDAASSSEARADVQAQSAPRDAELSVEERREAPADVSVTTSDTAAPSESTSGDADDAGAPNADTSASEDSSITAPEGDALTDDITSQDGSNDASTPVVPGPDTEGPEEQDISTEEDASGEIACLFGGLPCPDGYYCDTGGCGLGLEGVCVAKPSECEPSDQSVCACDGNTYASACFARQAGQRAIGPGPCPAVALNCSVDTSGFGFGTGCDVNEYCFGGCVGEGFCKERPLCGNAPGEVQCACNGLDYATPCKLATAGKNLDFVGWCGGPPDICGGPDQLVCENPDAICDLQSCNFEAEGLCLTDLECPPGSPPECGCDNVTYTHKCARIAAEVAFKHMGECGEGSCELGNPGGCGMGLYCAGEIGQCTGQGQCEPAPFMCGNAGGDTVPVCGCDGLTYPSMCDAQKADIPVLKYGECDA